MTQPSETFDTFDAVGNREDLSNMIYMLDVDEFPFMSNVGKSKATATLHEWQTDTLGTGSTSNAAIQGDNFAGTAIVATTRLTNRSQISKKEIVVSGTQEVVDKAGRDSEMAYQTAKNARILKMDMEAILCGNQASVTGDSTTASKLRSLCAWYTTNDNRGTGGSDGSSTAAATDATTANLRPFTEDLLKTVLQACYTQGGEPDLIIAGAYNRRALSGFAGNATRFVNASEGKLMTSIKVYESDFGDLKVMPSRHSRARDVHVLDTSKWAVAYLRPVFSEPIAKTGDAFKKQMIVEYTLEARNEASSAVIADLTSS